jgi:small subunit ribosomal protein S6
MFILDSNRYARDPGVISNQVNEMVGKCGGEVLASRLWNEQRLAYPIKGHKKGTYWLTYFRMNTGKLIEFNRACQLNENVLRKLVLKVEPRLVEPLVSHALGKSEIKRPDGVRAETAAAPAVPGMDVLEGVDLGN